MFFDCRTGDLMRVDADRYVYFVDRIGDTFRWRGENVSTSEVADIMHAFSAVQEAVVYGVEVPNYEGRAGMACVVLASPEHELFPWIDLYQHLETSLPKYAQPLFIRIQAQTEVTSTFKHRKLELVNSGFMPRDNDQLYWRDDAARTFVPLSQRVYDDICCGVVKL
jgi:acyl-CoA synthetase (AMP-forming)/AMP-acid ligase II